MTQLQASNPVSDLRPRGPRPPLDFVGVGAARCGTTWLARCLGEHPSVFIPARKELHYFNNDFLYEPTLRTVRRRLSPARPDQLRGEITPRYMISHTALTRIAAANPQAAIIVCLRDPVDRMFSEYCYFRFTLKREPDPDFLRAIEGPLREDYLVKSLYASHLENVLSIFDRVHVVLYEEIAEQPLETLEAVFGFLRIEPSFVPSAARQRVNASPSRHRAPRAGWARLAQRVALGRSLPTRLVRPAAMPVFNACHRLIDAWPILQDSGERPRLDSQTRRRLFDRYFREDLPRTEALLGLDLSRWRP